jgi:hypothetical protein
MKTAPVNILVSCFFLREKGRMKRIYCAVAYALRPALAAWTQKNPRHPCGGSKVHGTFLWFHLTCRREKKLGSIARFTRDSKTDGHTE